MKRFAREKNTTRSLEEVHRIQNKYYYARWWSNSTVGWFPLGTRTFRFLLLPPWWYSVLLVCVSCALCNGVKISRKSERRWKDNHLGCKSVGGTPGLLFLVQKRGGFCTAKSTTLFRVLRCEEYTLLRVRFFSYNIQDVCVESDWRKTKSLH